MIIGEAMSYWNVQTIDGEVWQTIDVAGKHPFVSGTNLDGVPADEIEQDKPLIWGFQLEATDFAALQADPDCVVLWHRNTESSENNRNRSADVSTRGKVQSLLDRLGQPQQEINTLLGPPDQSRRNISEIMKNTFGGVRREVQPDIDPS